MNYEDWKPWEFKIIYSVYPNEGLMKSYPRYILSYGTIVLEGKTRRALRVKGYSEGGYDYWVEGIGPLFGLGIYHGPQPACIPGTQPNQPRYIELLECYDGVEKIYDSRNFSDDLYTPEVVYYQ